MQVKELLFHFLLLSAASHKYFVITIKPAVDCLIASIRWARSLSCEDSQRLSVAFTCLLL